jgi:hypothetical protein
MTEEQRSDAPQIRGFATEGKPVGALGKARLAGAAARSAISTRSGGPVYRRLMQRSLGVLLCAGAVVAAVSTAAAQPADAPPEQAPEAASAEAPEQAPASVDRRGDDAWILYHSAYSEIARGERDRGRALIAELMRDHPDHPAAVAAARVLRAFDEPGPGAAPGATLPADDHHDHGTRERPNASARAELALYQSLHGIGLGLELCVLLDCDSSEAYLGIALLGGAGGLTGSLVLTQGGIAEGHRALLNSGTTWGFLNAALLLMVTSADSEQRIMTALMGGQLGGLALGQVLWSQAAPTEGQVALANTFGIWWGVLTLQIIGFLEVDDFENAVGAVLTMIDLGLLVGAYTAYRNPSISRGRTLLIDAGGIIGGLAGLGVIMMISGDRIDPQLGLGTMFAGTVAGLASAAYFSRSWDHRSTPPLRLSLMPHRDGGIMAGVSFDLDL